MISHILYFIVFSQTGKTISYFLPRRRFSCSIIEPLSEALGLYDSTEERSSGESKEENQISSEDFAQLSREEQLKVLEGTSWIKNIDFNPSFADVHSLTGGKKAKWKFQDSFYGNFNVGRRPSQDTAWGRR